MKGEGMGGLIICQGFVQDFFLGGGVGGGIYMLAMGACVCLCTH